MKLDNQQQAVVESTDKNILVVAGAGSGKTRVLTERVRHLMRNGVEPSNIVCITFTNMASQEMKQRLSDIPTIGDAFIGTIHSFANTIYRTSGLAYRIFSMEIQLELFKEMLSRGIGRKPKYTNLSYQKYLKYVDLQTLYDEGKVSEEELNSFLLPSEHDDLKEATKDMWKMCKERNIITFNELLQKTKKYYDEIGGKLEYVLVDEFQDVGKLEAEFIYGLNADNLFLVGDDWQSIYGFKGGDVNIFKGLLDRKDFKVYYLENNYRNCKEIVNFASGIIKQVSSKIPKNVNIMATDSNGSVKINTKGKIKDYLNEVKKDGNYRDWFILTRSNKEIFELQELLDEFEIPYMSFKRAGMSFDTMNELMQENTVKLLTVHVSKGLENKNVILYGSFPVKQPSFFKNEDERKVMYVGVTRAEERLIVLN